MAVETQYGIYGLSGLQQVPPVLKFAGNHGGRVRHVTDRVAAFSNGADIGSKAYMGRFHSSCVILPQSTVYFGAFGTNCTLDIGDAADDDALATDIAIASAGSSPLLEAHVMASVAGKRLWELLGRTSDPDAYIDLIATLAGAASSAATGTLAWSIFCSLD